MKEWQTDNIDNGRSKVKVVHTHATHSYVLSMGRAGRSETRL